MKAFAGWVAAWALFALGHIVSRPLVWEWLDMPAGLTELIYRTYQVLMAASSDVQDWGGHGPWLDVDETEDYGP